MKEKLVMKINDLSIDHFMFSWRQRNTAASSCHVGGRALTE